MLEYVSMVTFIKCYFDGEGGVAHIFDIISLSVRIYSSFIYCRCRQMCALSTLNEIW